MSRYTDWKTQKGFWKMKKNKVCSYSDCKMLPSFYREHRRSIMGSMLSERDAIKNIMDISSNHKERNIKKSFINKKHVYFLSDNESAAVKIGYGLIDRRIIELQIANPNPLCLLLLLPGDIDLERSLHCYFNRIHIRGEWFSHSELLFNFIMIARDFYVHPRSLNKLCSLNKKHGYCVIGM